MFRIVIIFTLLFFNSDLLFKYPDSSTDIDKVISTKINKTKDVFKFKSEVKWINIPKERNYDIISISYDGPVEVIGDPIFLVNYCTKTKCESSSNYEYKRFNEGTGVTFKLPNGELTSLTIKFSYYVKSKNDLSNLNIITDYKHSIKKNDNKKYNNYVLKNGKIIIKGNEMNYESSNQSKGYWYQENFIRSKEI